MSARLSKPYARPATRSVAPEGTWLHDLAPPSGPRAARQQQQAPQTQQVPTVKLIVSNLHYEITPHDLTTIFGVIGKLSSEPDIRYDRSGRSTGIATITFNSQAEATRAMKQLDGVLAKGQAMSIKYDTSAPRGAPTGPRGQGSASSLINRIGKVPLIHRLSEATKPTAPTNRTGPGPVRTRAAARPKGGKEKASKKPKTAEELDKELDSYGQAKAKETDGDIEMAQV